MVDTYKERIEELNNEILSIGSKLTDMIAECSEDEILSIELKYDISLPISYREFLRAFGKCNKRIFNDFEFSYPYPLELTQDIIFEELALVQDGYIPPKNIPSDIFVIGSCYQDFWFILTNDKSEESAIYYATIFQPDDDEFEYSKSFNSIWEFMKDFIRNLHELQRKHNLFS
jgi:SMI1-KNR4 cell-wall